MGKEVGWSLSTEGRARLWETVQVLLVLKGVLESPENSYGNYSGLEENAVYRETWNPWLKDYWSIIKALSNGRQYFTVKEVLI